MPFRLTGYFVATLVVLSSLAGGCGDLFQNQTASLGGDRAGSRGVIRALFLNNTDQRAVFTFGTFDPTDRLTVPDFQQFGAKDGDRTLDGSETSDFITLRCGRVFSIGSANLLEILPDQNGTDGLSDAALAEGVTFFDLSEGDADPMEVGSAAPLEALLGVDFPCGALLVIYLEPADVGSDAFRIDFRVIPAESTR